MIRKFADCQGMSLLLVLLVAHDLIKQWDPRRDRNLLDRVSLCHVLHCLQFVLGEVAVKLVFILEHLLISHLVDLATGRADRLTTAVFQRVQHIVVVLDVRKSRMRLFPTPRLRSTRPRSRRCRRQAWLISIFPLPAGYRPKFHLPRANRVAIVGKADAFGDIAFCLQIVSKGIVKMIWRPRATLFTSLFALLLPAVRQLMLLLLKVIQLAIKLFLRQMVDIAIV